MSEVQGAVLGLPSMRHWIRFALPTAGFALLTTFGFAEYSRVAGRLGELEAEVRQRRSESRVAFDRTSREQEDRLNQLEARLGVGEARAREAILDRRLAEAEAELSSLERLVQSETARLRKLDERLRSSTDSETRIAALETDIGQRLAEAEKAIADARALAGASREEIAELTAAVSSRTNSELLWRRLMGPVVQIAGRYSVGSGVLLASQPRPQGNGWRTYVLTAWHVVRDVQEDPERMSDPVPISIYLEGGGKRQETARLVAHDRRLDIALLELNSNDAVPHGARLAKPERLARLLPFDPVAAVGCPLGNDPIPTTGEIASNNHRVDGARYLMINAPTYIGNSGGAIYDGVTHELIGIFSKIYNHGSARPTIVPHMGLVVPLDVVYDWLGNVGYSFNPQIAGLVRTDELGRSIDVASAPQAASPDVHARPASMSAGAPNGGR
jgi:S1-C subfamily serine protease